MLCSFLESLFLRYLNHRLIDNVATVYAAHSRLDVR